MLKIQGSYRIIDIKPKARSTAIKDEQLELLRKAAKTFNNEIEPKLNLLIADNLNALSEGIKGKGRYGVIIGQNERITFTGSVNKWCNLEFDVVEKNGVLLIDEASIEAVNGKELPDERLALLMLSVAAFNKSQEQKATAAEAPAAAADRGLCVTGDTLLPVLRRDVVAQFIGQDSFLPDKSGNYNIMIMPIVNVHPGEYVLSLNEETQRIEPHRINALLDMGVKPVYRLTTSSGRSIKTTANHPYLIRNQKPVTSNQNLVTPERSESKWVKVSELRAGEEIAVPRNENLCAINFSAMANFGNENTFTFPIKGNSIVSDLKTIRSCWASNYAFCENEWIRLVKIMFEFYKYSMLDIFRQLQEHAFCPASKIINNHLNPAFFLTSWPETRPDLRDSSRDARNSGLEDSISSSISSIVFLSNTKPSVVPFLSTRRTMPFNENGNFAVWEGSKRTIFSSDNPFNNGTTIFSPPDKTKYNTPILYLSRLLSIPEAKAAEIAIHNTPGSEAGNIDILWDEIIFIEYCGYEHVYDIEVDGTHNFIGNGIFAHNTAIGASAARAPAAIQTVANPFGEIIRHLNQRFGLDIEIGGLPALDGELVRCDAYEEIMSKGEEANALYIINGGEVEIPIEKGGIGITFVRGEGNIVGEMGILGLQQRRSATVYAGASGAALLRIPYEKILPLMRNNPQLFFILNLYTMENRIYQTDLEKRALKVAKDNNMSAGDINVRVRERGPKDDLEEVLFLNQDGEILERAAIDDIRVADITAQLPITLEGLSRQLPQYAIEEHGYSGKNTWGIALDINPQVITEVWDIVIKYPHFLDVISGLDTKLGISEDEQLFIFYKLCVIYLTARAPFAREGQTPKARLRAYILQYLAEDALARTITYAAQDGALTVPSLSPDKAHLYGISSAYSELIEYDGVINSFYRAILRGELHYEMAVDFNFWTPGAYLKEEITKPMKEAIRILAERSGIRLSIHGPIFYAMPGVEYNSEIIVRAYKHTVDLAKEIGASSIVVHVTSKEDIDDLVEIALYGARHGIEISLENSRARDGGPYQNAERFLDVVKEVARRVLEENGNTDFLSQTWDFSHFALCPEVIAARQVSEEAATAELMKIVKEVLDWTFDEKQDISRMRLRKIHLSQHEGKADLHNLGVAAEEGGIGKVPNVKAMNILIERLTVKVLAKLEIILETAKVISKEDLDWLGSNVDAPIRSKAQDILAQPAASSANRQSINTSL